tara:strand:- start:606 stop:1298 length:693 start_codon:yes stop_codon:yes gene_type:complete
MEWSQSSIANLMSVSSSQYRKYENGGDIISSEKAMSFMLKAGIPYQYFFLKSGYHDLLENNIFDIRMIKLQSYICLCSHDKFLEFFYFIRMLVDSNVDHDSIFFNKFNKSDLCSDEKCGYQIVANNIRAFRQIVGLSQEEFSAKLGVSTNTISNYESLKKKTNFSIKIALRFWLISGFSPVWLTYGSSFFLKNRTINMRLTILSKALSNMNDDDLDKIIDMVRIYCSFKK